MTIRRFAAVLFLTGYIAVLSACAWSHSRLYDGPARPRAEVAVLKEQGRLLPGNAEITRIDNKVVTGVYKEIELLPGRYQVEVQYHREYGYSAAHSAAPLYATLQAEAGHEYELRGIESKGSWSVVITDLTTTKQVYP